MKKRLFWLAVLGFVVGIVAMISERLTPEVAGLAMGMILGIMAAGVTALVIVIAIDMRNVRQREEVLRRVRQAHPPEVRRAGLRQAQPPIDGQWRDLPPVREIEAPGRALTKYTR